MKYLLSFFNVFILLTVAQAQTSEWLVSSGGKHADCGSAVAITKNGEIILAGSFQGESKFETQTLISNGDTDIFLAKYSDNGSLQWIKQAGSNVTKRNTITEYPTAVAVDKDAIYLTGVIAGIAEFDNTKIISRGKEDIFIAKYDLKGQLVWVRRAGGSSQDVSYDIEVDSDGSVYITGFFQKEADFAHVTLEAVNNREFFLAKYSADGDMKWVKQSTSESFSQGKSLDIDVEGIVVSGEFSKETSFNELSVVSQGPTDAFLASYDFEGNLIWISRHGSTGIDYVSSLQLLDGNIFMAGSYLSNQDENSWRSTDGRDSFVSMLSNTGSLIWNKSFGGAENDEATTMQIVNNRLLVSGKYNSNFKFEDETYLSNGFTDIYILKMDLAGKYEDMKVIGGSGQDFPTNMVTYENRFYLTGLFRNQLTTTTNSLGGSDIFLSSSAIDFDHQYETKITYLVYPNPTENDFWIRSESEFNEIELIREDGRVIEHKKELGTFEYNFKIEDLPSGIYYVRIDGKSVKKLIIL